MSIKTCIFTVALLLAGAAFAQDNTASLKDGAGVVEFHVSPTGAAPFSSTDPALGVPLPTTAGAFRSGLKYDYWLSAPGTAEKPFATLFQAQLAARTLLYNAALPWEKKPLPKSIRIIIHGGTYRLDRTLEFLPEDSGMPECPITYEAAPGEKPVFSGGIVIAGWKKAGDVPGLPEAAKGKVWVADAPEDGALNMDFRQLYVNGRKAVRARTPNTGAKKYWHDLAKWDPRNRLVFVSASEVGNWHNLKRVEMFLQQSWENHILRVDSIQPAGDGTCAVTFQQPERDIVFSKPWPWSRGNDPYHFENAIEFLDEPGEWYLDIKAGQVYYWPREGEDLTQAAVVAPKLETLARFKGTADHPVHDITFKGVTFEDSTWLMPSQRGRVSLQATQYFDDISYRLHYGPGDGRGLDSQSWTARPPAGVYLAGVKGIKFERCTFCNMAATGLDIHHSAAGNTVLGCVFADIGGNGMQIARFSEDGLEAHLPYHAPDNELCIGDRIADSIFRRCGMEDWGGVGIAAGFVRGVTIEHNDIADMPYSGISVGWGWTPQPNVMRDNKILCNRVHDYMKFMADGGGIYMLSNMNPSEMCGNFIYDRRRSPCGDFSFMTYLDEGSAGITVRENLTEEPRNNRHALGGNCPAIGNAVGTTGPIADKAGLEQEYRDLLHTSP